MPITPREPKNSSKLIMIQHPNLKPSKRKIEKIKINPINSKTKPILNFGETAFSFRLAD